MFDSLATDTLFWWQILEVADEGQREYLLGRIKVHLHALKKYTYGKHIVARVEKLIASAGEARKTSLLVGRVQPGCFHPDQ